ncbi:MAG: MBL fold metallo-hydrolase [Perlucidibaca sp.]
MKPERNPAEALLRLMPARLALFARPAIKLPHDEHWDGRRFHNPGLRTGHGLKAALRWMRTRQPARWPQWVPAKATARPPARFSQRLDDWQVTFVNHSTVLLQIGPWNLLTDPVWSDRVSPLQKLGPRRIRNPGVTLEDLPPIHAVLLSHDHYDHLDLRTLMWLARRDNPLVVTGLGVGALLRGHGVRQVAECDWWQSVPLGPLTIHYVPAQHFSGRGARDRDRTLWGGLVVTTEAAGSCFFAGDTGYGPHFAAIRERLGAPRLAMLPIGAYEPRWFMGPVHMNPEDAVKAHRDLGARRSLAIHFNTFQLTDEAVDQPVADLAAALGAQGVPAVQFAVLREGEALRV